MPQGQVRAIHIGAEAGAALSVVPRVRAIPGQGLEGDRHFRGSPRAGGKGAKPEQEATLIEAEALEGLAREYGITLDPASSRRNILTSGVALNHLVDREFTVGTVRMRGIMLCEPCGHLEKLTQPGVRKGLVHRGGLRAQILCEGVINVGDQIAVQPPGTMSCGS